MHRGPWRRGATAFVLAGLALAAQAQTPPDAGRIMQEMQQLQAPPPKPAEAPAIEAPSHPRLAAPAGADDVRVNVTHFVFAGNAALSTEALQAAVAAWAGRALNFGELIQAVEAVEARYKEAGYFLAQGYLPPQKIRDGAIEIAISEGRLGEVRLEGESRVDAEVLYGYLDRLPRDNALQMSHVERQILLVNELAGSQASLDLQAGEKPGSTDIVLALKPDKLLGGRVEVNNHGAPSTGEKRLGLTVNGASPFNRGERISAVVLTSENRGLASYNLRGELPVGGDGWRLTAAASRSEYSLGGAFAALRASGTADSLRLGAAYPFVRSRGANLKLQVEADYSKLADKFLAVGTELDKQSRGITATLSGDLQDDWLGGGSSRADLALRSGRIALGPTAAAQDAPPAGPGAAGNFAKITLNAQRQQTVSRDVSLQLQITYQLAGKNLDSSEKLGLGGPATLPGYANGEATGDSGVHAKLGLRWQAAPTLALTAFTDYGRLRLAHDPLPGVFVNHKRLADTGLSVEWTVDRNVTLSAILAWADEAPPNPADNDRPRLWFTLGYAW